MDIADIVLPGAQLCELIREASNMKVNSNDYIVFKAGANDVYNGQEINIYNNLKPFLLTLKKCRIILGGIPFRRDLPLFHRVNENIMNVSVHL